MLGKVYETSCTSDEEIATVMTCLFSLLGGWGASLPAKAFRKGVRLGPSGHAVNRPVSVAERLPLALFRFLLVVSD